MTMKAGASLPAVDGPLKGAILPRLPATTSFWFACRDFFPCTTVYGLEVAEDAAAPAA